MGISRGKQRIAEGGKLVIIKRTWALENSVGRPAVLGLGSCLGAGGGAGADNPKSQLPSPAGQTSEERPRQSRLWEEEMFSPYSSLRPGCCMARGRVCVCVCVWGPLSSPSCSIVPSLFP